MKACKTCNQELPLSEFYLNRQSHSYTAHCKKCYNKICSERQSKSRKDNPEKWKVIDKRAKQKVSKETQKGYDVKSKYGLDAQDYKNMIDAQENRCAICNKKSTKRALAIDHCHNTNVIRGLLCHSCNVGIGFFNHDTELMKKAIEYLEG